MFKLHFKKEGCLEGKTQEEKNEFFKSLIEFNKSDPDFFEQQFDDLLPSEQRELIEWVKKENENMLIIKSLVGILGELLKETKKTKEI